MFVYLSRLKFRNNFYVRVKIVHAFDSTYSKLLSNIMIFIKYTYKNKKTKQIVFNFINYNYHTAYIMTYQLLLLLKVKYILQAALKALRQKLHLISY